MKKNLIYDTSLAYKSFLKRYFIGYFNIEDYDSFVDKKLIDFNNYAAVFFILNEEIEMIDLMWIYNKVDNLFVTSKSNLINKRMNEFDQITIIDFGKPNKEIVTEIRYHLNIFETNLEEQKVLYK